MGATNAARSTPSPPRMAYAAAVAPREWATRAWAGPLAATTAVRASANSRMVLRAGPARPGSEAPWLGASKVTTRWPPPTSGPTNAPSGRPHPPQPWTRYPTGPAPQASPATVWPLTWTWKGRPGGAGRSGRALALGTGNHRVWAQRAPAAGAGGGARGPGGRGPGRGAGEPQGLAPAGAGGGGDPLQHRERPNDRAFLDGGEPAAGHRRLLY